MEQAKPLSSSSAAAAALEALQKARASKEAEGVISGKDLTSLNKFLQWSTAHSAPPGQPSSGHDKVLNKTPEQLAADREWLDAAFPDMFGDLKRLVAMLNDTENPLSTDEKVEALEALQEMFEDLNYAVNIDKLGALDPVLRCAAAEQWQVRAAAVWALGTALKDLQEVKDVFMERHGHLTLAKCLADDHDMVRAKAVTASSALLRHSPEVIQDRFTEVGGTAALRRALADESSMVRRRAWFFLQYAPGTGNEEFIRGVLGDQDAVTAMSDSVAALDLDDVADVEGAVGVLQILVGFDRQGLFRAAPQLPGVIDEVAARCPHSDFAESLSRLAASIR